MTTTALTWFYHHPEDTAYELAERVRTTFWEARLADMWLEVASAESPYRMKGHHGKSRLEIEWVPGYYFKLSTIPTDQVVAETVSRVLKFTPALRYRSNDGAMVWEWHTDGGEERWGEIQGLPSYHAPLRLTRK